MKTATFFTQSVYFATLLFMFSIPWEHALSVPGIGTISRALGIPLVIAWLLMMITNEDFRKPSAFLIALFAFVFWCALTLLWNENTDIAFRQSKTYLQLYLSVLIIWTSMNTEHKCHSALRAYMLGAWVVIIVVFYNYNSGNVTRWDRRASIAGADENDIALTLSTCLPIAWYLATLEVQNFRQRIMSIMYYAYLPAAIVAIIMTGSRGGVASTLPFFLFFALSFKSMRVKSKLTTIVFVICAAYISSIYIPETPLQRIVETADELDSKNISGRYDIWVEGLTIWLNSGSNSFFGLGVGGYFWQVGRAAHSTYVSILVETGIVGMSLFLFAMGTLVRAILRTPVREKYLSLAVLAIWAIGASALSWEYRKPTWIIWGLLASLAYLKYYRPLPTPDKSNPNLDKNASNSYKLLG